MTSSTGEILAKRRRCPNLHAHVKALCLSPEARYRLEFPENFQGGVVDLPNLNRFRGESIPSINKRICSRCNKTVKISSVGECLGGICFYHDGRHREFWTCCAGSRGSKGCTMGMQHVHKGNLLSDADGFIKFGPRPMNTQPNVFALDTEMIYTVHGLEVAKVSFIDVAGKTVYERYIRPRHRIVDYNTTFSGITAATFSENPPVSLDRVHDDLKHIIFEDTILVGHSLKGDFRGLKIYHPHVVDTAFYHTNSKGQPLGLKMIAKDVLKRDIQTGYGHDSNEDAVAAMDLTLLLVKECDCRS